MAKAASPVRLQDDLMQAATLIGEQEHRSAAEQVEYWASLGRKISRLVNTDALLEVTAGLARIEPARPASTGLPPDPAHSIPVADLAADRSPPKTRSA